MPDGEASVIQVRSPLVRIIEGKVLSYVEVHTPFGKHVVTLKSSPGIFITFIAHFLTELFLEKLIYKTLFSV